MLWERSVLTLNKQFDRISLNRTEKPAMQPQKSLRFPHSEKWQGLPSFRNATIQNQNPARIISEYLDNRCLSLWIWDNMLNELSCCMNHLTFVQSNFTFLPDFKVSWYSPPWELQISRSNVCLTYIVSLPLYTQRA